MKVRMTCWALLQNLWMASTTVCLLLVCVHTPSLLMVPIRWHANFAFLPPLQSWGLFWLLEALTKEGVGILWWCGLLCSQWIKFDSIQSHVHPGNFVLVWAEMQQSVSPLQIIYHVSTHISFSAGSTIWTPSWSTTLPRDHLDPWEQVNRTRLICFPQPGSNHDLFWVTCMM